MKVGDTVRIVNGTRNAFGWEGIVGYVGKYFVRVNFEGKEFEAGIYEPEDLAVIEEE